MSIKLDKTAGAIRAGQRGRSSSTGQALALGAANVGLAAALAAGLAWAILAFAVLVPLGVALTRRPQRGILLLALLAPFDGLLLLAPPELPALTAGWKEALLLGTLVASFLAPKEARGPRRRLPLWAPAVAALLFVSVASGLAVGGIQALWGLKVAFFFVLVAIVLWRCPLDAGERDRLVTILLVVGVVTALYGIAQQGIGHQRLNAMGYEYNTVIRTTRGFLRSFSTFTQPFGFGYFLMLVLLVGVAHSLSQPGRLRSRLFALSVPVLGLGLASSVVRGAWIGLGVGLAYLGLTRFRVLRLGIPLAALALLFLPSDVSSAALRSSSGVQRVEAWQSKFAHLIANPLGVGIGASSSASEKVVASRGAGDAFIPDNQYFKVVYELGVIGLWFFVLLLVAAFGSMRAATRRADPDDAAMALSAAAMVLAGSAASLVAGYLDIFPMDVYFWMLLAVVETTRPLPGSTG